MSSSPDDEVQGACSLYWGAWRKAKVTLSLWRCSSQAGQTPGQGQPSRASQTQGEEAFPVDCLPCPPWFRSCVGWQAAFRAPESEKTFIGHFRGTRCLTVMRFYLLVCIGFLCIGPWGPTIQMGVKTYSHRPHLRFLEMQREWLTIPVKGGCGCSFHF